MNPRRRRTFSVQFVVEQSNRPEEPRVSVMGQNKTKKVP